MPSCERSCSANLALPVQNSVPEEGGHTTQQHQCTSFPTPTKWVDVFHTYAPMRGMLCCCRKYWDGKPCCGTCRLTSVLTKHPSLVSLQMTPKCSNRSLQLQDTRGLVYYDLGVALFDLFWAGIETGYTQTAFFNFLCGWVGFQTLSPSLNTPIEHYSESLDEL